METKNNNGIVTLLIIIILLLVCGVGFLGYKLYFAEDQNNPGNTNNPSQDPNNNNTNDNGNDANDNSELNENNGTNDNDSENDIIETMTISQVKKSLEGAFDSRAVRVTPNVTEKELKTNFKNIDKSNNNYNIVVSCTYYDKSEKRCDTYSVKVNSSIEYKLSLPGCTGKGELYSYNDYLVLVKTEGCSGATEIKIYDKNNNEVYKNTRAYSYIYDVNDEDYNEIYVKPTIINNTLYFVEDVNDDGKMFLVSVDLSKSTIKAKTTGEFAATHVH